MDNISGITNFDLIQQAKQLEKFNSQLKYFNSDSEKTFLDIGGKLQNYIKNSRLLTQSASQITATISNEIYVKGIADLELMLEELSDFLNKESERIRNDKTELIEVHSKLQGIGDEMSGFERIVKRLRMLGISTKIESARLSMEDTGFFALAENVDKLSGLINDKITVIKKKSDFLLTELTKTASALDILELKQRGQSEIILNKTARSLNSFKSKNIELSSKVQNISELSSDVSESINQIVSSIQFHDITRQQMEHSMHALDDVKNGINSLENKSGFNADFWSGACDVYELQSIQLENSLDEFSSAVANIISNLDNVEKNISSLRDQSFELLREDKSNEKHTLKSFEEDVAAISEGLFKNIEIGKELAESIKSIIAIVDDLSNYIVEIEEVGSEIEIIALNARVKAAHFGSNGSALGVLSESIQKLSLEAKQQTISTSKILGEITSESQQLRANLEEDSKLESESVVTSVKKINEFLTSLLSVESGTQKNIGELNVKVEILLEEMSRAKSGVNIHQKAKEIIENIIYGLNATVSILKENGEVKSNRKENTKSFFTKYTMKSERKIHEKFSESTGSNLLYHKNELSEGSNDESLGDNIELF